MWVESKGGWRRECPGGWVAVVWPDLGGWAWHVRREVDLCGVSVGRYVGVETVEAAKGHADQVARVLAERYGEIARAAGWEA